MNDIPIKVADPVNYVNPCNKHKDLLSGFKTYLVSHVNQNYPLLKEHTQPLESHYNKVNNAASSNASYIYYRGLEGGCLQGNNPDVNPAGGNWFNTCHKKVNPNHTYDLGSVFRPLSPGAPTFDDEQKAILQSLNEAIPGFNQLHISNEQFCKYDNSFHYIPQTDDDSDIKILGDKVTDGVYNPTECSGKNDPLCEYFLCPAARENKGAKCGATNNRLWVMKDTQQYKQTLDGQYLDAIGPDAVDKQIKAEWGEKAYDVGNCVSPGDSNCQPSKIRNWVAKGKQGQGEKSCIYSDQYGYCQDKDYVIQLGKDITYDNAPVLTTAGTCYYAGVGGYYPGPATNIIYNKGSQYLDRYVNDPKYNSTMNKWNYTGGTAYGMLDWHPKDDSNQITRALNSIFAPGTPYPHTNQSFDLAKYKTKCGANPRSPGHDNVSRLQEEYGGYTGGTDQPLSPSHALTLTCPIACPYDHDSQTCIPRAVCGDNINAEQQALKLVNWHTPERPCPIYCPAGPPTAASSPGTFKNICTPQEGLYQPICPPMGTNYSLIGRNLGMIEAPKHNSAFFHNRGVDPTTFQSDLDGFSGPNSNFANFQDIFTSTETIGRASPGGKGKSGFDKDGYYQMPQGVNAAEPILCEYTMKSDPPPSNSLLKGATPNFVDILTDPRQVAWMWEGTAESGLPPKDNATQISTLGLYIRGKPTTNPQLKNNLSVITGSINDTSSCSPWQDQMIDLCMNHEVQNKDDCYRPSHEDGEASWRIRYPLDIPPDFASPSTNTVCPIIMAKPQQDVWKDYHGIPDETARQAINSEYNTGKYCKDWYHTMADTYSAYVDKGADIASQKFNIATRQYCHKIDKNQEAVNTFNFECGCINADPGAFQNKHSSVVSAMMQGGPESLGQEQKYCYLGACDVGSVGSMQHDRLIDPRYGSWSYPDAPVIQNPKASPCSTDYFNIPCTSPANAPWASPTPCWKTNPEDYYPPDPLYQNCSPGGRDSHGQPVTNCSPAPAVAMCQTPLCSSLVGTSHQITKPRNCSGYVSSSLQKCPNFSCEELLMNEGSMLENDEINAGMSICQRHGTGIDKRWQYDAASRQCIFTEGATIGDSDTAAYCKNHPDICKTLVGNTNDPYFYPTFEACTKATSEEMKKLPRTGAPPPYPKSVFTDRQLKWSCSNKECISALGVGEYTSSHACSKFCGSNFTQSPIMLIIIILVSLGIFVAFIFFALHRYKKNTTAKVQRREVILKKT